jgi:uncharacterized membrane protein YkvA (DUF1232 family)
MTFIARLRTWAKDLKRDVVALWLAARDDRVPWPAKVLAALVAAYALSPIDLIPDFIPVIGYLDDLILVPLGIAAVVHLIPPALMTDLRRKASVIAERPRSGAAAGVIVAIWIAGAALIAWLGLRAMNLGSRL